MDLDKRRLTCAILRLIDNYSSKNRGWHKFFSDHHGKIDLAEYGKEGKWKSDEAKINNFTKILTQTLYPELDTPEDSSYAVKKQRLSTRGSKAIKSAFLSFISYDDKALGADSDDGRLADYIVVPKEKQKKRKAVESDQSDEWKVKRRRRGTAADASDKSEFSSKVLAGSRKRKALTRSSPETSERTANPNLPEKTSSAHEKDDPEVRPISANERSQNNPEALNRPETLVKHRRIYKKRQAASHSDVGDDDQAADSSGSEPWEEGPPKRRKTQEFRSKIQSIGSATARGRNEKRPRPDDDYDDDDDEFQEDRAIGQSRTTASASNRGNKRAKLDDNGTQVLANGPHGRKATNSKAEAKQSSAQMKTGSKRGNRTGFAALEAETVSPKVAEVENIDPRVPTLNSHSDDGGLRIAEMYPEIWRSISSAVGQFLARVELPLKLDISLIRSSIYRSQALDALFSRLFTAGWTDTLVDHSLNNKAELRSTLSALLAASIWDDVLSPFTVPSLGSCQDTLGKDMMEILNETVNELDRSIGPGLYENVFGGYDLTSARMLRPTYLFRKVQYRLAHSKSFREKHVKPKANSLALRATTTLQPILLAIRQAGRNQSREIEMSEFRKVLSHAFEYAILTRMVYDAVTSDLVLLNSYWPKAGDKVDLESMEVANPNDLEALGDARVSYTISPGLSCETLGKLGYIGKALVQMDVPKLADYPWKMPAHDATHRELSPNVEPFDMFKFPSQLRREAEAEAKRQHTETSKKSSDLNNLDQHKSRNEGNVHNQYDPLQQHDDKTQHASHGQHIVRGQGRAQGQHAALGPPISASGLWKPAKEHDTSFPFNRQNSRRYRRASPTAVTSKRPQLWNARAQLKKHQDSLDPRGSPKRRASRPSVSPDPAGSTRDDR